MISNMFLRQTNILMHPKGIQVRFLKRPPINTSQLKSGRRVGALGMKVCIINNKIYYLYFYGCIEITKFIVCCFIVIGGNVSNF